MFCVSKILCDYRYMKRFATLQGFAPFLHAIFDNLTSFDIADENSERRDRLKTALTKIYELCEIFKYEMVR